MVWDGADDVDAHAAARTQANEQWYMADGLRSRTDCACDDPKIAVVHDDAPAKRSWTDGRHATRPGAVVTVPGLEATAYALSEDLNGKPSCLSSARPSSSVFAVVTTVTSKPRTRSMRSWSISWKIDCSVMPKV